MLLSRLESLLVDVRGLLHGIAAVPPHFREHGGHVVTVASIGAHWVVPTSAAYSATKYAAEVMPTYRAASIPPDAVAGAIGFAIDQPDDVDVNEVVVQVVVRPTRLW
nr:SDR family oxidoreductase [Nocardioides deserti]